MKHKVLILGTLGEFTELVQKAKKRGGEYKQAARWIEDNLSRRLLVYKTLGR